MDFLKYSFEPSEHRGKNIILIQFGFDKTLDADLRKSFHPQNGAPLKNHDIRYERKK
ncbi:hypothetical protein [Maribacter sp. 2304DJ31-5]|uniref:hypothetical protein n=1 Tax=Maribacter sp. 2304DJ31-5 TaxID=3386273 RepID=UPI0039BC9F30